MNTNHLHLNYDSSYALGDFMSRLSERPDATEKLVLAFNELLGVIQQGPASPGHYSTPKLMESGLVHSDASDSDGEVFENAMENLYLRKEPVQNASRPTIRRFKSRTF